MKIKYLLIIPAVFVFVFGAAKNVRAVPDPLPLEVLSSDPLFAVSNAAPGESFSSEVKILNHGGDSEDFQFEIQVKTNPKALADRLTFKITNADGTSCFFGCPPDDIMRKIGSLDGKEFKINRIGPHSTNVYNFVLTFDADAGNEFQAADMSFDIKLGYKGDADGGGGGDGGGDGGAAGGPGFFTAALAGIFAGPGAGETIAGEQTAGEGEVAGETTPAGGEVEGAEVSLCAGWPKWVWILMLVGYFAAFVWHTFENIKQQIEKREIRWRWQAVLAAAAFLIWYFFDKCREFQWFVILAILGGVLIYLLYLYLLRKSIKEQQKQIKD